jgi:hypothetical protein
MHGSTANGDSPIGGRKPGLLLKQSNRRILRVFENRVLRRISGPKRDENGSWRKLHNDQLHNLYSSPNIVRVINSRSLW